MQKIKEIFSHVIQAAKASNMNLLIRHLNNRYEKIKAQDMCNALYVDAVSVFIELFARIGNSIAKTGNKTCVFNGEFWQEVKKDDMRPMLRDVALAIGVPPRIAQYHEGTNAMYKQVLADATNLITGGEDADTSYINCSNGTIHLKNGIHTLKPFNKAEGLTYKLGYEYDPNAQAPKFHAFLNQILPEHSLQEVVGEYVAYALADKKKRQKVMFFYGKGANGKGTLIEIVSAVLGRNNVIERSCESLCDENSRTVADLEGKRLNVCSEMGKKVNITNFKMLASGDPIMARRLYGEPYTITDYAKLLFSCNELPKSIEHTYAYFRRLILVPFRHTVPDNKMNHTLAEEIINEELSGVLNWVLESYERLMRQGYFTVSEESAKMLDEYRIDTDAVSSFIDEKQYYPVEIGKGIEKSLPELFEEFKRYCDTNNFHQLTNKTFSGRLRDAGFQYKRKSDSNYVYLGVRYDVDAEM